MTIDLSKLEAAAGVLEAVAEEVKVSAEKMGEVDICYAIFSKDGEYIGLAYGKEEAHLWHDRGMDVRAYTDFIKPECR